jgi:hypothetical protein
MGNRLVPYYVQRYTRGNQQTNVVITDLNCILSIDDVFHNKTFLRNQNTLQIITIKLSYCTVSHASLQSCELNA